MVAKFVYESISFKRAEGDTEIKDVLTDNVFRPGRLFVYRDYKLGSRSAPGVYMYLGIKQPSLDPNGASLFLKIGIFNKDEKRGEVRFYGYANHLQSTPDKAESWGLSWMRPLKREEIDVIKDHISKYGSKYETRSQFIKELTGFTPFF
jgi:hypothetical protein